MKGKKVDESAETETKEEPTPILWIAAPDKEKRIVAVELAPVVRLASRAEGTASFKATFCENDLYDLKIIF